MSMTEVVEESLKADARFRHLTVMPNFDDFEIDHYTIQRDWSEHVDSWLRGECKLGPIAQFVAEKAIHQMVRHFAERMK